MAFCQAPDKFQQIIEDAGVSDKIYTAMQDDDLAALTLTALQVLKDTDSMPIYPRKRKSEQQSNEYREEGNKAYVAGKYKTALRLYNQALCFAPNNFQCMKLAYSNRSALFQKTKNYSACLKDIDTCIKMSCSNDILMKLEKRKKDCQPHLWREQCPYVSFRDDYFVINKKHRQIPCLSSDVKIITDPTSNLPMATAANDIKVGTVISCETAYSTLLNPMNEYLSCYYCHKMSLNLQPCLNCCYVMFCGKECKQKCLDESHSIECQIEDMLKVGIFGPYSHITFRTVIKLKLACNTWKEFIQASNNIGTERMRTSPVEQTYDGNYKFSILSFKELRGLKPGAMFNFSFMAASFINELMKLPFFFPYKAEEKDEAINAVARMTMGLLLKLFNIVELNNVADNRQVQMISHLVPNYGYFAFASKLNHSCYANLFPVALNNKVGLVALQPIQKGDELTLSFVDHAYDFMHLPTVTIPERRIELIRFATVCHCPACDGTWKSHETLSDSQRKFYRKWMTMSSDVMAQGQSAYKITCDALTTLHGLSHTKEFRMVYCKFRSLIIIFQFLASKNFVPSD